MAEAVGLALGAWSLVLSGLEHYKSSFHIVKSSRRSAKQIKTFCAAFDEERRLLELSMTSLLEYLDIDPAKAQTDPAAFPWADAEADAALRELLSSSRYSAFVDLMTAIISCLKEIRNKVEKLKGKSNTMVTLRVSTFGSGLESLLDTLRAHNRTLRALLDIEPRRTHVKQRRTFLRMAEISRQNANMLFETLNEIHGEDHPIGENIFLQNFSTWDPPFRPRILLPIHDLFEFQPAVTTKMINLELHFSNELSGGVVRDASLLVHRQMLPLGSTINQDVLSTIDRQTSRKKRVKFLSIPSEEQVSPPPTTAATQSNNCPAKVLRFSELGEMLRRARENRLAFGEDPSVLVEIIDIIPLSELFDSYPAILRLQARMALAASLARDVVCLMNTPWIKQGLRIEDVFFIRRNDMIDVNEPLVHDNFKPTSSEQSVSVSVHPRTQLLCLGFILVELSMGKRLSEFRDARESGSLPADLLDIVTASRLIDDVANQSGTEYSDVVRRCIHPSIDHGPRSASGALQKEVYEQILLPLQNQISFYFDRERPQGSSLYLEVPVKLTPRDNKDAGHGSRAGDPPIRNVIPRIGSSINVTTVDDLPVLHGYVSQMCRMCDGQALAFTQATLEVQDIVLGIEEAQEIVRCTALKEFEEQELLRLVNDCLANVLILENFFQGDHTSLKKDDLDGLTMKLKISAGSLSHFNQRHTVESLGPSDTDAISVASISETDYSSVFDEDLANASSATSFMEPVWSDAREVADQFLLLIKEESLLGPLLGVNAWELDKRQHLFMLLERYSEDLLQQATQQPGMDSQCKAARFIRGQASYITNLICIEDNQSTKLEKLLCQIPGETREQKRDRTDAITRDLATSILRSDKPPENLFVQEVADGRMDPSPMPTGFIEPGQRIVFAIVKEFLVSGRAFGKLRLALRNLIRQGPMDIVRQEIFSGFSSSDDALLLATINVQWDIREYCRNELGMIESLGPVLTVTGDPRNAFATTCANYLDWNWPNSANDDFNLLDAVFQTMQEGSYESAEGRLRINDTTTAPVDFGFNLFFSIVGSKNAISSIAQQLVWLSSVFRTTTADHLSLSHMDFMWTKNGHFELRAGALADIEPIREICWHPLLGKSVIANRFPIPSRDGEVGLELPFQSLIRLCKVSSQMEYGDKVLFYGSSTLLYPTSLRISQSINQPKHSCVQWHLIANEHPHISATTLAECDSWPSIEDKPSLPVARTIVGYCKAAHIHVGTKEFGYDEIAESELNVDESMPGIKIKSITIASSGMGIAGVQVAMDTVYPRSLEVSPQIDKYDDILGTTRKMSMILYDSGDQRGWLLPAQNVLLHMAQCWIKKNTPNVKLPFLKPAEQDAEQILRGNYKLFVKTLLDDDTEWCLRDLIKQIWRDLQGCMIARRQKE